MAPRKHHLTPRSIAVDEVKSLLQKAIRREDRGYAMKAVKELGKTLKEKHLVTYLLEDHGLASGITLREASNVSRKPLVFTELLIDRVKPSRYVACMPVYIMCDEYNLLDNVCIPLEADDDLKETRWGIQPKKDCVDIGIALTLLRTGWRNIATEDKAMMLGAKLLTVVMDHEKRVGPVNFRCPVHTGRRTKANLCQFALAILWDVEEDKDMVSSLEALMRLAAVPQAELRLVLFCAVVRKWLMHGKGIAHDVSSTDIPVSAPYKWNWSAMNDDLLIDMPQWAVDKHTYRGRVGKDTRVHYTKAISQGGKHSPLPSELIEEFHGERKKKGLKHFLTDGVLLSQEAIENDIWVATKDMYMKQSLQCKAKTVEMTKIYVSQVLRVACPQLFHICVDLATYVYKNYTCVHII